MRDADRNLNEDGQTRRERYSCWWMTIITNRRREKDVGAVYHLFFHIRVCVWSRGRVSNKKLAFSIKPQIPYLVTIRWNYLGSTPLSSFVQLMPLFWSFSGRKEGKTTPTPTTASRESRYSQVNIDLNFELPWNCPHSQVHAKKFSDEITHPTQD